MNFLKLAALIAGAFTVAAGAPDLRAQAQTRDQSGAMTLSFTIAKYVEFVSHAPSAHVLETDLRPGSFLSVPFGEVMREFRANTPFSLSVAGITSEGQMAFTNSSGESLMLEVACSTWDTSTVESQLPHEEWDCNGGSLHVDRRAGWASLRVSLANVPHSTSAGEYSGTVFFVIESF